MKKIKNVLFGFSALLLVVLLIGCGDNKNVSGTLEEIMDKVYANIPEEERPMMLMNIEVNEENVEMFKLQK